MLLLFILQLWTSVPDRGAILSGHWQSCWDASEGRYGEMAYDHVVNGRQLWTFHMGERDDFALFKGYEPENDDHDSPLNLLSGHHALSLPVLNGKREWTAPSLRLWISVVQAGGSREECLGFYVRIEQTKSKPLLY